MNREYYLMNRQRPFLRFLCERDASGKAMFSELQWLTELRPIGYGNLRGFLVRRLPPKNRRHVRALLERFGCSDLEIFLRVTHGLSLNDTLWVKEADSSLAWENVSLYANDFDPLVSEAAFDGVGRESGFSLPSPEFGTDGSYDKCWVRDADGIRLYKGGVGLEPVSEFLVCQLAPRLCRRYVEYDLGIYRGRLVSKCALFTSEQTGLVKASDVFGWEQSLPRLLAYCRTLGCEDDFRRMCVLDALTLNTDRHYGNFSFLFDNATMEILTLAPVFDNNRALLPELDEEQLAAPDQYAAQARPRLGPDFILMARELLTEEIRADLETLRGFRFVNHPVHPISDRRLELLSALVQRQLDHILEA